MRCYLCGADTNITLAASRTHACQSCIRREMPNAAWWAMGETTGVSDAELQTEPAEAAEFRRTFSEITRKLNERGNIIPIPVGQPAPQPVRNTVGQIVGYTIPVGR